MSFFDSFLEIAGNLGFLVGNNDRRRTQARKEKRLWGPEQDGFAIALTPNTPGPGTDSTLSFEIALRNMSDTARTLRLGSWLTFFKLRITEFDGSEVALSSFGVSQLEAGKSVPQRVVTLQPGETLHADLPVGVLYHLNKPGSYLARATAQGVSAVSNEATIRI